MNSSTNTATQINESTDDARNPSVALGRDAGDALEKRSIRLLIAHEDPAQANETKSIFKDADWITQAHRITSVEDLNESLQNREWNIILAFGSSKMYLPALIGNYIDKNNSTVHAIFIDESYSPTNATQIMQCGFRDYITSEEPERLLFVADREIQSQRDRVLAKDTEKVLAEANARSQLLMDSTTEAIAYVTDGMIVHANPVFAELLKFESADHLECFPFIDLLTSKDQVVIKPLLRQYQLGSKEESGVEVEAMSADGKIFKVELALALASYEGESCTQVILRPLASRQICEQSAADSSVDFDMEKIQRLEGKGSIFFASIASNTVQRKKLGLRNYLLLIDEVSRMVRELVPPEAHVFDYLKESWVVVIPGSHSYEPTELAERLCEVINTQVIGDHAKGIKAALAVGISKYGVADINIEDALDRAFKASAEKQLDGESGYTMYVPKIDNAEGAAALQSALELNRFRLKYQPIIALQKQETHFYDTVLHIENDAGRDDSAEKLLASLGIEKTNAELDRWIINEGIDKLKVLVADNNIQLNISLTASAVMDDGFFAWVSRTLQMGEIPKGAVSFSIKAADAMDYEKHTRQLVTQLRENDYKVCLSSVGTEHMELLNALRPNLIKLSVELTDKMSGEEAQPGLIKEMIDLSAELNIVCIASGVNSAGELAQLWQAGVPYVQGSYLQMPLSEMDYEFLDIS